MHGQAFDWEDRRLPTAAADALANLTVHAHNKAPLEMSLSRDGNTSVWAPKNAGDMPKGMRFDAGLASSLARSLSDLRGDRLVDTDPGDAVTKLLAGESLVWTLAGDDAPHTLRLGATVPEHQLERFAQVDGTPQLYTVSVSTANNLLKSWDDLRDLTVMAGIAFTDVKSVAIQFSGAKKATTFTKKEDGTFTAPRGTTAKGLVLDSVKLRTRTQQALLARAIKFEGPQKPQHGIAVSGTGALTIAPHKGAAQTLQFGRALKGSEGVGYYARGSASPDVYVISKALHDTLLGGLDTLTKKPLPSQANTQVAAPSMPGLTPEMEAQIRAQMAEAQAG